MSSTLLRPLALLCGYDLRTIRRSDSIDLNLRRYIKAHEVGLVIDCGAHVGEFARMCRWAGYPGRLMSFEPASEQFAKLERNAAADPGWSVHRIGLGAEQATLALNINAGSNFNSVRASREDMTGRFPALVTTTTESIEVRRLEQVLDDADVSSDTPIFLKTDTQGYDLEVIQGAGGRLAQVQAVMVEMPVHPIYQGAPDHWSIAKTLRDLGFDLYSFSTVSRDAHGGVIEYDAIWKRST